MKKKQFYKGPKSPKKQSKPYVLTSGSFFFGFLMSFSCILVATRSKIQINQQLCIALPRALAVVARLARSVEARRETAGDIPATISNIHLYNRTRGGLGVRTAPGTFYTLHSTHIPTRTQ